MNDAGGVILLILVLILGGVFIGGVFIGSTITYREFEKEIIRSCSMTGTHIIDENTIIVCQVLKVRQTETPVQDGKKPEVSL